MPCNKRTEKNPRCGAKEREEIHTTENMPSATTTHEMPLLRQALLTATMCEAQIHLVVGNNSLASARCQKSLDAGAKVVVISPGPLSPSLQRRVDEKEVSWLSREFLKEDLTTLGREEVDGVVDLVFVTLDLECAQCKLSSS
jgi:hypothetical protein